MEGPGKIPFQAKIDYLTLLGIEDLDFYFDAITEADEEYISQVINHNEKRAANG